MKHKKLVIGEIVKDYKPEWVPQRKRTHVASALHDMQIGDSRKFHGASKTLIYSCAKDLNISITLGILEDGYMVTRIL